MDHTTAEPTHTYTGEPGEVVGESSGYVTTKQAAKALGVTRRTVQSYVRRGELEAVVEGEGVEKTFYVSIDSLNALREQRRREAEAAPNFADVSPSASREEGGTTNSSETSGEASPDLLEVVQDL